MQRPGCSELSSSCPRRSRIWHSPQVGCCRWLLPLAAAAGCCRWPLPLAAAAGCCCWLLPLAAAAAPAMGFPCQQRPTVLQLGHCLPHTNAVTSMPLLTPSTCWLSAGTVQSMPHALDEHVPALAGPLPVASAATGQHPSSQLMQRAGGPDSAQALLLSR